MGVILIVLFGVALFLSGYYLLNKHKEIKLNGVKIKAEIVSYEEETNMDTDGDYTSYFYPVIQFTDNGNTVVQKYSVGTSLKPKQVLPEKVEVYYFFNKIKSEYELFLPNSLVSKYAPSVLIIFGLVIVVCSIIVYLFNVDLSEFLNKLKS